MTQNAFDLWTDLYRKQNAAGEDMLWPSETLVRLFKGSYVDTLAGRPNFKGLKVLDIGCGLCNNLSFLGTLGLDLYGTEVSEEICVMARERMAQMGHTADIRPGTNRALPYEDNTFDFLVSWNVLHYEDNEADIVAGIAEYARVLKPGGRLMLSTTGPDHKILQDGETVGPHLYRIGRGDDHRKGQVFFYFDSPNYIHYYFDPVFRKVQVGRTHDFLMSETLDWFIVTGVKP